ncbi:MAG: NAD-dependent epimerase/dehydratase family protein [Verrucomicrobia bacterium]|nr:NAD-dependent epimerase/dehydratase family protein [Verrucomicrobiota bacterium]
MDNSRKRIFITGIAGFIGFHLAQKLHRRGDQVFGCDNFNSYYDPLLKKERAAILAEQKIEVMAADLCKLPKSIEKSTHLVHLAAQAGVRYSITHPEKYQESNLDGFFHVLETVRRYPQIPLIFASSSSVYGLNKKIPFSESDPTDHPANFYGATKKSNEVMAFAYHNLYGIRATGLRFFTVYGPYGRPDMAYFAFAKAIQKGEPIKLYNQGKMERDFTYIDDIVDGIISAIDLGAHFEIFNLGNNRPEKVEKLVQLIEEHLKKKATIERLPMPPGEIPTTFADIAKAQKMLCFQPKISLETGMKHFLDWLQNSDYLV